MLIPLKLDTEFAVCKVYLMKKNYKRNGNIAQQILF